MKPATSAATLYPSVLYQEIGQIFNPAINSDVLKSMPINIEPKNVRQPLDVEIYNAIGEIEVDWCDVDNRESYAVLDVDHVFNNGYSVSGKVKLFAYWQSNLWQGERHGEIFFEEERIISSWGIESNTLKLYNPDGDYIEWKADEIALKNHISV